MTQLDLPAHQSARVERRHDGDIAGDGFRVPNGDFARVLGIRPHEGLPQRNADERVAGWRVIEDALHQQLNHVGMGSLRRYEAYRNLSKSVETMRGRGGEQFADASLEAMKESVELGAEANMRYLEMQYQFQFMSQNHSCVSNLMKARYDSVKKSINEIR